jgi:hypothetical protein
VNKPFVFKILQKSILFLRIQIKNQIIESLVHCRFTTLL